MLIKGKRIVIIGFGKEGVSAANYLYKDNLITIVDQKGENQIDPLFFRKLKSPKIDFYQEKDLPSTCQYDYIIRSPGVRPDHPLITRLVQKGAILTSATRIFFDECPAKIIGVTGTKGKGTTATLIYQMLKTKFKKVYLAGNIGTPMLDILPHLTSENLVVLELSSFQLIDLKKSPHIAVVLMITQEHLDWHKNIREYHQAKVSIVKFQTKNDFAVINADFEASQNFASKTKAKVFFVSTIQKTDGVYIDNDQVVSQIGRPEVVAGISDIFIPGAHNLQNVIAATAVAKTLDIPGPNIRRILKTFKGLACRLQLVREVAGIKFYNDSFSTIPETTIAAIEAFSNPKILVLGGSSKKSDFTKLGQKIANDKTIKALILVGQEGPRIGKSIAEAGGFGGKMIEGCQNMAQIMQEARKFTQAGDVVILSPACASFDMFKNYQDRGDQFIKEVKNLKKL